MSVHVLIRDGQDVGIFFVPADMIFGQKVRRCLFDAHIKSRTCSSMQIYLSVSMPVLSSMAQSRAVQRIN
jgi:hypothetical protein